MRMTVRCAFLASVILVSVPASVLAQGLGRFWAEVTFGAATPTDQPVTLTRSGTLFNEPASWAASYPSMPASPTMEFGGGARIKGRWSAGAAVSFARFNYHAGIGVQIPSPAFFNTYAVDNDATATLRRREVAIHTAVYFDVLSRGRMAVRLFGGPSVLTVSHDMVSEIAYSQSFGVATPSNAVDITTYSAEARTDTGIGFNAGADFTYAVNKRLGVVVTGRFAGGRMEFSDPLSAAAATFNLGGVSLGAGVRFGF